MGPVLISLVPLVVVAPLLIVISRIDRATSRIPDCWSLPTFAIALGITTLLSVTVSDPAGFWFAVGGAAVLSGIFGAIHLVRPDGLGMGDVKLCLALGIVLGWGRTSTVDLAIVISWMLMVASGLGLLGVLRMGRSGQRIDRHRAVPFGPFLTGATAVSAVAGALMLGPTAISW